MFLLKGIAAHSSIDQEDCLFELGSITIPAEMPPLLVSHRNEDIAGSILSLSWSDVGMLIECIVEDQHEHVQGFSVGCTLQAYEIKGKGREAHAIVKRAHLDEVSITNNPANLKARVTHRERYTGARIPMTKQLGVNAWDAFMARSDARQREMKALLASIRMGASA